MPPRVPSQAQQAARRAIQPNKLARPQQLSRHPAAGRGQVGGGGAVEPFFRLVAFAVSPRDLVLITKTDIGILHTRPALWTTQSAPRPARFRKSSDVAPRLRPDRAVMQSAMPRSTHTRTRRPRCTGRPESQRATLRNLSQRASRHAVAT
jgi:hypothetical protein